jgi:hypothetical protein
MAAAAGRAVVPRVERQGEDSWRVWPMDETWLPALTAGAMAGRDDVCAAVIREHPQHEGVLLQGPLPELLRSAEELRLRLRGLATLPVPTRVPDFDTAALLRRALTTRPVCLAAVSVAFTDAVENCEAEPLVAHRLGQLAFRAANTELLRPHEDVPLLTPPGAEALASHLRLPEGVELAPGLERVKLGVRARPPSKGAATAAAAEPLALLRLEPGSVHSRGHAKFMGVTAVSYWPAWQPLEEADAARARELGFEVVDGAVLGHARREFLLQAGVRLKELPRHVELDFEALSFASKEAVLQEACQRLEEEVEAVAAQLSLPVAASGGGGGASACPDVPLRCADRA